MCESFIEITVEIKVPFIRTIVVPTDQIEEGIAACMGEFPGVALKEGCQDYREGESELVISKVKHHR